MKNRILAATLAALLALFAFVACGGDTTPPADTTAAPDAATDAPVAATPSGYTFDAGKATLFIGADPSILGALGDPLDKLEAASCVHEGFDRVYYYAGFEVNTVPTADGREVITSIYLTDDSVTTTEGVYIGAKLDDVKAAYAGIAATAENANVWRATKGDEVGALNFLVDAAGIVTSIYYN